MTLSGVITGDIIRSQTLDKESQAAALAALEHTLNWCQKHYGVRGELYRGDAFQVLVDQPQYSLLVALLLRLALRTLRSGSDPIDARIAIAIAPAEQEPKRVATGRGEAFVLSGRQLESMSEQRLAFSSPSPALQLFLPVLFRYLDTHISGLNHNAATALQLKLLNPELTHDALAERMGVGRTSYTRFINRAGIDTLLDTLAMFEKAAACDSFWDGREMNFKRD